MSAVLHCVYTVPCKSTGVGELVSDVLHSVFTLSPVGLQVSRPGVNCFIFCVYTVPCKSTGVGELVSDVLHSVFTLSPVGLQVSGPGVMYRDRCWGAGVRCFTFCVYTVPCRFTGIRTWCQVSGQVLGSWCQMFYILCLHCPL